MYELTVYLCMGDDYIYHSIAEAKFTDMGEMIDYCSTFCTDSKDYKLLFDVWNDDVGQFNINEFVEVKKNLGVKS